MMNEKTIIFGIRAVAEAIENNRNIDRILIKKGLQGELFLELKKLIDKNRIPFQNVPVERINRETDKNHQGVIAFISPVEYQDFYEVFDKIEKSGKPSKILLLDGLTDVRNFGAISRTAECAGFDAIIVPEKKSAPLSNDAIKTSAGALFNIPVCKVSNLWYILKFLKEKDFYIVAASEKAENNYKTIDYPSNVVLVMGSEDKGISSQVQKIVDINVAIPIRGKISSLNVSVAAGILMYEIVS